MKEMTSGGELTEFGQEKFLESPFVKKYWDARVFGNTFLEKNGNKGYIKTGVVQFGVGISISPIDIVRQTNTSKAGVQEGKNAGMAPLAFRVVEHGVYCMPFFVNPNYANKSGCTAEDIELLKLLIPHLFINYFPEYSLNFHSDFQFVFLPLPFALEALLNIQ